MLEMGDGFVRESPPFQSDRIEPCGPQGISGRFDIGRDILGDSVSSSDEGMAADLDELMYGDQAANVGVIVDLGVSAHIHGIGQDDVIADPTIMGDMYIGHQEAVMADCRFHAGRCAAMETAEFADDGPVSDLQCGRLPPVFEILRRTAEDRMMVDATLPANPRPGHDEAVCADLRFVTQCDISFDNRVRTNGDILSEFGPGIDDGAGMNGTQ